MLIIAKSNASPLVSINLDDGSMTFGPDYDPDETARRFWDAISYTYAQRCKQ